MKTASAILLYNPLSFAFSMLEIGGSLSQKRDGITGEYSPDRTITPMVLRPSLSIEDPDGVLANGDYTSSLIDTRWYIGSINENNRITQSTPGYSIGLNGELSVAVNVQPSSPLTLFFSWAYLDPRRNEAIRRTEVITLTSVSTVDLNLSIEIDIPRMFDISPFKTSNERTITATLKNGDTLVDDQSAIYEWLVLENGSFRKININDMFYVNGQDTKSITIDKRFIDKESIMVRGSHIVDNTKVVTSQAKIRRNYGQWDEQISITRGKYIRPNTTETEVEVWVEGSKGIISNPTKYFDIGIFFKKSSTGDLWRNIAHGTNTILSSKEVGTDSSVKGVFGTKVRELSALRPAVINGNRVLINGKTLCLQVPIETNE